jgi:sec-independent protein translocase protein TatA
VGDIGAPELVIIGIIIVLLFGATRLPATAKGLGQALRLFKKEIRADDEPAQPAAAPAEITAVREQVTPAPAPATAAPFAATAGSATHVE